MAQKPSTGKPEQKIWHKTDKSCFQACKRLEERRGRIALDLENLWKQRQMTKVTIKSVLYQHNEELDKSWS